jgi:dynein heavy chain
MIYKEPLDDLLDKMNQDYLKTLLSDNEWPDAVKKEFVTNVHTFMAFLNEYTHAQRGQTYLYIPQEDLSDPDANAKDRDLVQRLESIVIGWTRQIKELVSSQDTPGSKTIDTPLDEINYWKRRTLNLQVLTDRLMHPDLNKITKVLARNNSSYLQQFTEESDKIVKSYDEAKDNLKFLNLLFEPCNKISRAAPVDIPKLLPEVLNKVRMIWELSGFYATEERMKGILVKISNQIIDRCKDKIKI